MFSSDPSFGCGGQPLALYELAISCGVVGGNEDRSRTLHALFSMMQLMSSAISSPAVTLLRPSPVGASWQETF